MMDIYSLLNHYLYNPVDIIDNTLKGKVLSYIISAPYQGPMNSPNTTFIVGSGDKAGVAGWLANNKFTRALDANGGGGIGEFPGLDFMLLYNLFWLVNQDPSAIPIRYTNGNILDTNNDITKSGSVYRDAPIYFGSKITPDPSTGSSSVYMKSSVEINLIGGFETVNNTDILMEAKPLGSIDGIDFRPMSASDNCSGFDFSVGVSSFPYCSASCSEPQEGTYSWTVKNGTTINTYTGNPISFRITDMWATYYVTCVKRGPVGDCAKTKSFTPIIF